MQLHGGAWSCALRNTDVSELSTRLLRMLTCTNRLIQPPAAAAIGICCLNPDGGDYAEWLPQVRGGGSVVVTKQL